MPTVARYPRACVICELYPASAAPERACCPASAAPERDLRQHADRACVRRELRADHACVRRELRADHACVRCEQRAGAAPPPFDPACHGARLPAAIDGATMLYPYHTERASWFYVLAAQPHQP